MSLADVQSWGSLSAPAERLGCIAALCPVGLLDGIHAERLALQVKGSKWISGRSDSKTGRVQTSPPICLPPGRLCSLSSP